MKKTGAFLVVFCLASSLVATQLIQFTKTPAGSGGGTATQISEIDMAFYTDTSCSSRVGSTIAIIAGTRWDLLASPTFGFNSLGLYNVYINNGLDGTTSISNVRSIDVYFRAPSGGLPQIDTGYCGTLSGDCCVKNVTCSAITGCTSFDSIPTQSFALN